MRAPVFAVLAASLVMIACPANAQNLDTLDRAFRARVQLLTDSLVGDQRKYVETLLAHGDEYFHTSAWALRRHLDSLLVASHDSLDITRANAMRLFNRDQEQSMRLVGLPARTKVDALFAQFEQSLRAFSTTGATCTTCRSPADYDTASSAFEARADSLAGFFGDSMATIVEGWESAIDDTSTGLAEALDDSLQSLKDDYTSYLKDHATRFEIDAAYESHAAYRGRDNGVSEGSFGPTATYHHSSGLYLAGSLGWITQTLSAPDVSSLSAGYEFTASPLLQGSVSYTHFWYSSSSPLPQAVTDQEVSGTLALAPEPWSIDGTLLDDFNANGGSEITIDLGVALNVVVSESAFGGTLELSPTAGATWGQQSERLLQKRIVRAKKKEVVRVSGSPYDVFSIMSYSLSLPIELQVGNVAIVPDLEWTLPVDVLNQKTVLVKDPSSSSAFLSGGITVSMTFY